MSAFSQPQCPLFFAIARGVKPLLVERCTFAPALMSWWTTDAWPFLAARNRGVPRCSDSRCPSCDISPCINQYLHHRPMAFVGSDMQGSESIPYTIYPVHVHPRLQKGTDRAQVHGPCRPAHASAANQRPRDHLLVTTLTSRRRIERLPRSTPRPCTTCSPAPG